ncbi:hypothetical protein GCM10008929_19330 [Alkalibacterium psychrotolerans]
MHNFILNNLEISGKKRITNKKGNTDCGYVDNFVYNCGNCVDKPEMHMWKARNHNSEGVDSELFIGTGMEYCYNGEKYLRRKN